MKFDLKMLMGVLWLFAWPFGAAFAQKQEPARSFSDTVTVLQEVTVSQSRLQAYAIGHHNYFADSTTLSLGTAATLTDLMRQHGLGRVRTYGPGGVASPAFRGTGASHTAVLWNGINLQSPLTGQLDFSGIPAGFIDEVQVQLGGSASLHGSGAVGGTIHLNNKARFGQGLRLHTFQQAGQFNAHYQQYGLEWSGQRFISSTRFFRNHSDNNFPYLNYSQHPAREEERRHSGVTQYGLLQQNYWQKGRHLLGARLWLQDNATELPNPVTVERPGQAEQQERTLRGLLNWQYDHHRYSVDFQSAWLHQELHYTDPSTGINDRNRFSSAIQKLEVQTWLGRVDVTGGLNYTREQATVDAFGSEAPFRNRLAAYAAAKYGSANGKLTTAFNIRQEWIEGDLMPLAPSLGVQYRFGPVWQVAANASRNYRIPTFNDLFWRGSGASGNATLRPEQAWSHEISTTVKPFARSGGALASLKWHLGLYSNLVDDWILWRPTGAVGWSPENIKKVWARGVETRLSAGVQAGEVCLEGRLFYTLAKATNQQIADGGNPREKGRQLMYTPLHEGSFTFTASWRQYQARAVHNYTGRQFTDGGNSEAFALPAFQVLNLFVSRKFSLGRVSGHMQFEANNLLNERYEPRRGYPMPGRNFRLGARLDLAVIGSR